MVSSVRRSSHAQIKLGQAKFLMSVFCAIWCFLVSLHCWYQRRNVRVHNWKHKGRSSLSSDTSACVCEKGLGWNFTTYYVVMTEIGKRCQWKNLLVTPLLSPQTPTHPQEWLNRHLSLHKDTPSNLTACMLLLTSVSTNMVFCCFRKLWWLTAQYGLWPRLTFTTEGLRSRFFFNSSSTGETMMKCQRLI